MNEIQEIIQKIVNFRDDRDWEQFHKSKNLAIAISIEAAELNELFLWKTDAESELVDQDKLKEELADVLIYSLLLSHRHGLDVKGIILEKVEINSRKYPISKSKGSIKKYNID